MCIRDRYAYDRKDAPWADAAGLDTLWRQSVKNDWLRLKLAGKPADEIRKTLDKRYANLLTSVQQLKGDEVFQSFMNAYTGSIDPHTDYMNPRSAENFNMQMSNSLEGIGAVLFRQDDVVLAVSYTHLDVYKRQRPMRPSPCAWRKRSKIWGCVMWW